MSFEEWYAKRYVGNDAGFKMHIESAWNAAIDAAELAVEAADAEDSDAGNGAIGNAMMAVCRLKAE